MRQLSESSNQKICIYTCTYMCLHNCYICNCIYKDDEWKNTLKILEKIHEKNHPNLLFSFPFHLKFLQISYIYLNSFSVKEAECLKPTGYSFSLQITFSSRSWLLSYCKCQDNSSVFDSYIHIFRKYPAYHKVLNWDLQNKLNGKKRRYLEVLSHLNS